MSRLRQTGEAFKANQAKETKGVWRLPNATYEQGIVPNDNVMLFARYICIKQPDNNHGAVTHQNQYPSSIPNGG